MERKLQLSYNTEWQRFVLRDSNASKDDWGSFEMVINCGWDGTGWYTYDFVCWFEGEAHEVCTRAQFNERVRAIEQHEGTEASDIWRMEQDQVIVVRDNHPVFKLVAQWEAMETLGLFSIPVDHFGSGFQKELNQEVKKKIDEARGRYQLQEMKEWDAAMQEAAARHEEQSVPDHGDWAEANASKKEFDAGFMDPKAWASEDAPPPSIGVVDSPAQERYAHQKAEEDDNG